MPSEIEVKSGGVTDAVGSSTIGVGGNSIGSSTIGVGGNSIGSSLKAPLGCSCHLAVINGGGASSVRITVHVIRNAINPRPRCIPIERTHAIAVLESSLVFAVCVTMAQGTADSARLSTFCVISFLQKLKISRVFDRVTSRHRRRGINPVKG